MRSAVVRRAQRQPRGADRPGDPIERRLPRSIMAAGPGRSDEVRGPGLHRDAARPRRRPAGWRGSRSLRSAYAAANFAIDRSNSSVSPRYDAIGDPVAGAGVRAGQGPPAQRAVDGHPLGHHLLRGQRHLPVPQLAQVVVAVDGRRLPWCAASRGRCPSWPASAAGRRPPAGPGSRTGCGRRTPPAPRTAPPSPAG
jgi:hypothetical protein